MPCTPVNALDCLSVGHRRWLSQLTIAPMALAMAPESACPIASLIRRAAEEAAKAAAEAAAIEAAAAKERAVAGAAAAAAGAAAAAAKAKEMQAALAAGVVSQQEAAVVVHEAAVVAMEAKTAAVEQQIVAAAAIQLAINSGPSEVETRATKVRGDLVTKLTTKLGFVHHAHSPPPLNGRCSEISRRNLRPGRRTTLRCSGRSKLRAGSREWFRSQRGIWTRSPCRCSTRPRCATVAYARSSHSIWGTRAGLKPSSRLHRSTTTHRRYSLMLQLIATPIAS